MCIGRWEKTTGSVELTAFVSAAGGKLTHAAVERAWAGAFRPRVTPLGANAGCWYPVRACTCLQPPKTLPRGGSVTTALNSTYCSGIQPSHKGCTYISISIMLHSKAFTLQGCWGPLKLPNVLLGSYCICVLVPAQRSGRPLACHCCAAPASLLSSIPRHGHTRIFVTLILLPAH